MPLILMKKIRLLQRRNGKLFGEPKLPIVVILFWPGDLGDNFDLFPSELASHLAVDRSAVNLFDDHFDVDLTLQS